MEKDSQEIRTMRAMAWQRAKGELLALLNTYWNDGHLYMEIKPLIKNFIKEVDDRGLTE